MSTALDAETEANLASWMNITTVEALRAYQRSGPEAKTCVIYVRQSRGSDTSESIENQIEICQSLAAREGLTVVAVYADRKLSGKDFGKRQVDRCIEHVRAGEAQVVVMWKWSRFGRNLYQSLGNLAVLDQVGGIARAATEDVNVRTAMGKFSRNTMLNIAEFELDRYSEGWKEVHDRRVRGKGLPAQGTRRFGYIRDKSGDKERYIPDPLTGPLLIEAYERYIAGEAALAIAKDFNARGIRSTRGNLFTNVTLLQILDTGFACGYMRRRTNPRNKDNEKSSGQFIFIKGSHEPLISMETWKRYTDARKIVKSGNKPYTSKRYPLSGRLLCDECGARMIATTQGKHGKASFQRQWRCGTYLKKGIAKESCSGCTVTFGRAEAELATWLSENATIEPDESLLALAAAEAKAQRKERVATDVEAQISRLERRAKMIRDDYYDEQISREERDERIGKIETEVADLREQMVEAQRSVKKLRTLPDYTLLATLAEAWDDATTEERRKLLADIDLTGRVVKGRWGVEKKIKWRSAWDD